MSRRRATLAPQVPGRAENAAPNERYADGTPSKSDFLRFELPAVMDLLAEDYEGHTMPGEYPDTRQFVATGRLVPFYVLHLYLDCDDTVVIYSITL